MKNLYFKFLAVGLFGFMALASHADSPAKPAVKHEQDPKVVLETLHDQIVTILEKDKERLAKEPAYLQAMLEQIISPKVDYKAMGALMLGKKYWLKATPEQRKQFIDEFRSMLIRIYGKSVSLYNGQKLTFDEFEASKKSNKRGRVHASVKGLDGNNSGLDFYMRYKNSDGWKVYDISVQGISMIKNYRSSFQRDLEKVGIDGLLKKMAERGKADKAKEAAAK